MTYKPDPDKLGIDISIRLSVFVLLVVVVIMGCLLFVSDVYIGLVLMLAVMALVSVMPIFRRLALRNLHKGLFDQSLEIEEGLLIYRGPHGAVTTAIPVSAIDADRIRISLSKAIIPFSTPEGVVQIVSIPLHLYDHEVFEALYRILPHKRT